MFSFNRRLQNIFVMNYGSVQYLLCLDTSLFSTWPSYCFLAFFWNIFFIFFSFFTKEFVIFLVTVEWTACILKSTERTVFLKDNCWFKNSPPFKRSACFYVTLTGNLDYFQYFYFETTFLKNKNFFQKTRVPFFS